MPSLPDTSFETPSALYCAGCNERFLPVGDVESCPRCGAEIDSDSQFGLSDTLLFRPRRGRREKDAPDTEDSEADPLLGRDLQVYRCQSLLGAGGMGRVYLAMHTGLHRQCALKILSPKLIADDEDYVRHFQQEGRATASIVHPNIVTVHAIGEVDGLHFLEMEFVTGHSLQQAIDDEGRLSPLRATTMAAHIAEGLSIAHRTGIVHRDLKPDNILLTQRRIPKIADFGLAKRIATGADGGDDKLAGTPNFMAPELFNGQPATPASDVYALGVSYFLMLTGRVPFIAGSVAALQRLVTTDPLPNVRELVEDVPLEMAECLNLLMDKSAKNRPQDGIEAAQLLQAVVGQIRDIESLLAEAFSNRDDVTWQRAGSRYRIDLSLPDGRSQVLYVQSSKHSTVERLLLIYSVCCEAQPEYYENALRMNAEMSHGGLSIRDIDGRKCFVMVDTYPRGTVDVEEIRRSVLEVAYRAGAVEKLLTGFDRH